MAVRDNYIIRPMISKDVPQVWEIEKLCFSLPWPIESFQLEVESNKCARYYAAERDARVVGYGGMWVVLDEAHITNIAVHPDCRGIGIGQAIMEYMMIEGAKMDIKAMTLEVRVSNTAARNLYRKLGFKDGGIRKKYYADNNEDALIMWNFNIGQNTQIR